MPRKYLANKKGKFRTYNTENISKAVDDVKANTYSIRKAAEIFGVPKSTIADCKVAVDATPGRKPVLPKEVEDRIVRVSTLAAQKGMGVSRRQLMLKTGRICQTLNLDTPFNNSVPGKMA